MKTLTMRGFTRVATGTRAPQILHIERRAAFLKALEMINFRGCFSPFSRAVFAQRRLTQL
jgi:hypothetical protein